MPEVEIPQQLADFTVLEKLGMGGNGTFYLAVPPARLGLSTDRVVVKVFGGVCSDDAYRRGVRELRAFAAVVSPYLAGLYDAVLQGQFMYAMEYFPLGSLGSPARELSRDEKLAAIADAARGVDATRASQPDPVGGDLSPRGRTACPDTGGSSGPLGRVDG